VKGCRPCALRRSNSPTVFPYRSLTRTECCNSRKMVDVDSRAIPKSIRRFRGSENRSEGEKAPRVNFPPMVRDKQAHGWSGRVSGWLGGESAYNFPTRFGESQCASGHGGYDRLGDVFRWITNGIHRRGAALCTCLHRGSCVLLGYSAAARSPIGTWLFIRLTKHRSRAPAGDRRPRRPNLDHIRDALRPIRRPFLERVFILGRHWSFVANREIRERGVAVMIKNTLRAISCCRDTFNSVVSLFYNARMLTGES